MNKKMIVFLFAFFAVCASPVLCNKGGKKKRTAFMSKSVSGKKVKLGRTLKVRTFAPRPAPPNVKDAYLKEKRKKSTTLRFLYFLKQHIPRNVLF